VQFVRKHAGGFSQERRLTNARATEQEQTLARLDEVTHDGDGAEDSSANSASEPDDFAGTIADRRDAVKSSLDSSSIVSAKGSDAFGNKGQILAVYLSIGERHFAAPKPGFRRPSQIHDDLDEIVVAFTAPSIRDRFGDPWRQHGQENVKIVGAGELVQRSSRLTNPVQIRLTRYISRCYRHMVPSVG
jgi:hypothetical protein